MAENTPDSIVKRLENRIEACSNHYSIEYQRVAGDLRYIGNDQWSLAAKKKLRKGTKPVTHNVLRSYQARIVAPFLLHPIGGNVTGSSPFLEPLRSKIRKIEKASGAKELTQRALEDAVAAGYGWLECATKMVKGKLEIRWVRPTEDPCSVMVDPDSTDVDAADARYAIKCGQIPVATAKEEFGENDYSGTFTGLSGADGQDYASDVWYYGVSGSECKVYRYIGHQRVLDAVLPIPRIPIVPVYGSRYRRDDNKYFWDGIVRQAQADQDLLNLYKTIEADRIARAPKAQWMIERRVMGENRDQWNRPNDYDTLIFDTASQTGEQLPAPQRIDPSAAIADLQNPMVAAAAGVGEVLGMPPSMFGIDPEATGESGKAVLARQSAGELATAQYTDNLNKAVAAMTEMTVMLIPHVYTAPERVEVTDEFGGTSYVMVNWLDPQIDWENLVFEADAGPALMSKRKEDANLLIEIAKLNPQSAPMLMDIALRAQDSPGAKEMARRLNAMLPAEIRDAGKQTEAEAPDPAAMQALQAAQATVQQQEQEITAMQELIGQLQAQIIANEQKNEIALTTKKMEVEKDIIVARENNQVKLQIAVLQTGQKQSGIVTQETGETEREIARLASQERSDVRQTAVNVAQAMQPQTSLEGVAPGGIVSNGV